MVNESLLCAAFEPLDRQMQGFKKARAVFVRKGRRPAEIGHVRPRAQVSHDGARGDGRAYAVIVKRFAARREDHRPRQQAALGEKNISGNHHAIPTHAICDIIICGVETVRDYGARKKRMLGHANITIANHDNRDVVAVSDFISFLAHRAGVGIDINSKAHYPYIRRRLLIHNCPSTTTAHPQPLGARIGQSQRKHIEYHNVRNPHIDSPLA